MKVLSLCLLSGMLAWGCGSPEKNNEEDLTVFSNLIQLNPPNDQKQQESKVYTDSVQILNRKKENRLLISGHFPDGCSHLKDASHRVKQDTLKLTLSAWKNPDMMCTQVLTPFSFIYENLSDEQLEEADSVVVNGTAYRLE